MKRNETYQHLLWTVLTAMFAAMIYVMTAFVHIPTHQGYIHVGDGLIFLAACILPTPYAIGAASIGAGLSDYLSGYAMWVLPTIVIKAATAAVFSSKKPTIINRRNLVACAIAAFICVGGYYLAGVLLAVISGSEFHAALAAALADIPTNVLQIVGSTVLYVILGAALDKMGFRNAVLGKHTQN